MKKSIPLLAVLSMSLNGHIKVPEGYPELSGAVVYIEKDGLPPAPPMQVQIDQKDMTFIPHVTVLTRGSTIQFNNFDPTIHGLKAAEGPLRKFHFVMTPKKKKKKITVSETGVSELLCDMHAQMSAFVVSLETSLFAVTNADGAFTINGLPPFPFKLTIWHSVLPGQSFNIESESDLKKAQLLKLGTWNN